MSFYAELKRRNVFRVAIAYLAGAWLLVEVVETLFPVYGLPDAAIRLVVTLLAIGFPVVLIFSWVYELTPEGFKLEKDIDRSVAVTHHTGKKLDRIIIVLLALALGYFAVDKFVLDPGRDVEIAETAARAGAEQALARAKETALPDKSIAVLPFVNMSPDPEDEYFSDGLTEELIGALVKVGGLHVTARTSAFAFKGENRDIRDVGKRLNVKTVLEGSVRREKNRVRITAQLINVEDGFHLWSESYDHELESVLALQEAIARAIVGALRIQLSPETDEYFKTRATASQEAYDLYLKGRYYWARMTQAGFLQGIEAFQQAIAADPEYAPPHAGLATVYSMLTYFGMMPPHDGYPLSLLEADAALTLDPNSSEALIARGMTRFLYEWDWERAREDLTRALELSPGYSQAHWANGEYLAAMHRHPEALSSLMRAHALDPLSLPIMNSIAFKHFDLGQFEEAIQQDQEMLALDPNFAAAHWSLGVVYMHQGQLDAAIEELTQSVELSAGMPPTLAMLAYAHAKSGDEARALAVLAELKGLREPSNPGYAPPLLIAYVYEGLGMTDDALDWLEQAFEERDGWLVYLNSFPRFESLRGEPRFQDILRRLDLPQNDHGEAGSAESGSEPVFGES